MNRIQSYDDLLEERRRLELLLQAQKELIRRDVAMLKEEFRPVQNALSAAKGVVSPRTDNLLLRTGLGIAGDLLLRSSLIAGGGWIARLVAPVVVKNVSNLLLKKRNPRPHLGWLGKLLHRSNGRS
jgi:hypothetical protein